MLGGSAGVQSSNSKDQRGKEGRLPSRAAVFDVQQRACGLAASTTTAVEATSTAMEATAMEATTTAVEATTTAVEATTAHTMKAAAVPSAAVPSAPAATVPSAPATTVPSAPATTPATAVPSAPTTTPAKVVPGTGADEHTAIKPLRAIIAIRSAGIRGIGVISPLANRRTGRNAPDVNTE